MKKFFHIIFENAFFWLAAPLFFAVWSFACWNDRRHEKRTRLLTIVLASTIWSAGAYPLDEIHLTQPTARIGTWITDDRSVTAVAYYSAPDGVTWIPFGTNVLTGTFPQASFFNRPMMPGETNKFAVRTFDLGSTNKSPLIVSDPAVAPTPLSKPTAITVSIQTVTTIIRTNSF